MSYSSNQNEFNNITREKLDSMSVAELLELLESINETMTEDNFDLLGCHRPKVSYAAVSFNGRVAEGV